MVKAVGVGADAVVLDLEDAVSPRDKVRAREAVRRVLEELAGGSACEIHVRINRLDAGYDMVDISAVVLPGLAGLRLPKCESAADVLSVASVLDDLEDERGIAPGTVRLYPTIETAAGVVSANKIAAAGSRIGALVFGAADFAASIGVSAPSFEVTLLARSTVVLASAAAGVGQPLDGAFLDLTDPDGLSEQCRRVKDLGFMGKSAIHPKQLSVIHDVFTPSHEEVERARRIVAAVESGDTTGIVDGWFVDPPVIAQARSVLDLARRIEMRGD